MIDIVDFHWYTYFHQMVKASSRVKMPATEAEMYPEAAAAFRACLGSIPAATVTVNQDVPLGLDSRMQPDFVAEVEVAGRHVTLAAEMKRSGEPQFARDAIHQIKSYLYELGPMEGAGIFIAPYISEATAKLCRDEEVGYLDLAGNCHVAFRGVYIHVEGRRNPFAHSRSLLTLYQPKAERVLRVLLTNPVRSWRLQGLADEARVSVGQSFKVKELLLEKEWLRETGTGVSLTKPRELLADWEKHYRAGKHHAAQFYTLTGLDAFERGLSHICRSLGTPCAFTGLAAAARYAPYAAYQRATAYVSGDITNLQEPLGLAEVQTGANVILLSPYDSGVFYGARQQQGISLASPLQTYLDLQSAGGRGREAAEVLLQEEIAPKW